MSVTTAAPQTVHKSSALRQLTVTEARLYLRDKMGPFWAITLPVVLLVIFGAIPAFKKPNASFGGYTTLDVYIPILILFTLTFNALISTPLVLAGYREMGVLRRLRTTPAGPARVLTAQLIINLAVAVLAVILVLVVARLGYGVFLPRNLAGFALAVLFALAALLAMGLLVAAIGPTARAATAFGMLLFYPMVFFSGMWYPIPLMPSALQHLAHATPVGAAGQAMSAAAVGQWPQPLQLGTMAAWAVLFGLAAARWFRWE